MNINSASNTHDILLTVIVPIKNEQNNIRPLIAEIDTALHNYSYEIIYVDDGSTDDSLKILRELLNTHTHLRIIQHHKSAGQSAAIRSGILSAKGKFMVTLDGDGQNDPADIPSLVKIILAEPSHSKLGLVAGQRVKRIDSKIKRLSSKIANKIRQWVLQDNIRDTGCGLKVFRRDAFLLLPYFDHIHRYLPALMLREGYQVKTCDVNHRARAAGISKYGTLDRLLVGITDLLGVIWLCRRKRIPLVTEEVHLKEL